VSVVRQTYTEGGRTYVVSPDERLRVSCLAQAIISARLEDENTLRPPSTIPFARTTVPKVQAKATPDGIGGISGVPEIAFPALRVQAYDLDLNLGAPRYLSIERNMTLGPQPAFPDVFTPIDLGVLRLHRVATVLRGRVTQAVGVDKAPVAGATVTVNGIWRTAPPANVVVPPDAPNIVSLQPGAYFERPAAAGQIRSRGLAPVAGDSRTLLQDLPVDSVAAQVSNRQGIAAGTVLEIEPTDPSRAEFLTVNSVITTSPADQPATVTLDYGPRLDHRIGAELRRVTPQAPGIDNALIADTVPGDACVLAAALVGMVAGTTVEIHGGGSPAEFHRVFLFAATADADGFYRLPPLNRVAQVRIRVDDGATPFDAVVTPDYGLYDNIVEFTF
jgi:hypothetical protein